MFQDAHAHITDKTESLCRNVSGISKVIFNTISLKESEKLIDLYMKFPDLIVPSVGLHPWRINEISKEEVSETTTLLKRYPFLHIGEVGLDSHASDTDKQMELFAYLYQTACDLNKIMSVHCFKAFQFLLPFLKKQKKCPTMIFHRYSGGIAETKFLSDYPVWFSVRDKLPDFLPKDRILLETDSPSLYDDFTKIKEVYQKLGITDVSDNVRKCLNQ